MFAKIILASSVHIISNYELNKWNTEELKRRFTLRTDSDNPRTYLAKESFAEYNDFKSRWVNEKDSSDVIMLAKHIPTPIEMLTALQTSDNPVCERIACNIIDGKSSIEKELTMNHGSFIVAVLQGDFETALHKADSHNKKMLLEFIA